jgi:hypothetical protein
MDRYVEVIGHDGSVNRIYTMHGEKTCLAPSSSTEILYSAGVWHTKKSGYYTALITRLQPCYQCNGWINNLSDVSCIAQHTTVGS